MKNTISALFFAALVALFPSTLMAETLSVKGDQIGMSLEDYKSKYARSLPKTTRKLPFCSDSNPDFVNSSLLQEEWHIGAGVVTCSTHFPYEQRGENYQSIAGAKTTLFIHHFFEGTLYKISIVFPQSEFSRVRAAFEQKYGQPAFSVIEKMQNRMGATFNSATVSWQDGSSSLALMERVGRVDRSTLVLADPLMNKAVESRAPGPDTDDI